MTLDPSNPNFVLLEALREQDPATAERLIETLRAMNYVDSRGSSALMIAVYCDYATLCEKVLAKGADVLHFVEILD